ncbi:DNA gyrase subunit B [Metamycoplasma subdolum]|uniref:DNA gyrase subunit B n=1 Tax=Metamycoplasma subdolum TaxID=92407 RepID=A0A3M0A3N2_9BACT|nr:DNA topoisomerase subunit B [Metamycoplasma subdolum]RMA79054.1 DNA gyrase subunit B [Metamycoplasma subdolum]WPB50578.1 DNA topoisomerase subunit B [Metamycoplasma subdolum]
MEEERKENSNYGAENIEVLEGLEAVRVRPGMYIGTVGFRGLHHLIWEIVDNSVDEAMAGYASEITINLYEGNFIEVIDNGRGIPVDIQKQTGKPAVETILTVLHAGGKFHNDAYKFSGGLHGVGASVVNALSDVFEVWVKRDGKIHYQKYTNGGKPAEDLKIIGECPKEETGTTIKFHPDFTIMNRADFDFGTIVDHAKQIAYLNKGLIMHCNNYVTGIKKTFLYEGGIVDYVQELNTSKKTIFPNVIYAFGEYRDKIENELVQVEIAMQYSETYTTNVISYANNIQTIDGGTHEQGFLDALTRIYNNYAEEAKLNKNANEKISREDVKSGLTAIISIKHSNPIFEGQTKGKLENRDARIATNKVLSEALEKFLKENPDYAKQIVSKCLTAQKSRIAAALAFEASIKKDSLGLSSELTGKLADCSSKNAEIKEIFIVEGNSAGGSAKMGRDRHTQAILPLRGKVINSEKADSRNVLSNKEIATIIHALGTGILTEFNINKLKYHKIVIMTDADVDGAHISTLLLTFFYRYMRPLIEYGFVYIAQPPLYKISAGKVIEYAYNDNQKDEILAKLEDKRNVAIQRYKGLGEMDPEQLWETTMDPARRKMLQVQIDDFVSCDWVFTTLMGEEIEPRRDFIQEHAKYAKNIDF